MLFRFGAAFTLVISALVFPWWLSLVLFLIFVFSFNNFYEAIIAAFLFDILSYQPEAVWPTMSVTAGVILVIYLSGIVKQWIVFYH